MRIEKVTYNKLFPTSSFLNERVGVEIILNEGDNAKEALQYAKQLCEEFNKESNPELYKHNETHLTAEEASIAKQIEIAPTLERLAEFKGNLTQNTKKYYLDRLKELSKK